MRNTRKMLLAVLFAGLATLAAPAQDDEVVQRQKKRGVENWKRAFDNDNFQIHETANFIFFAPKAADEAKLKALAEKTDTFFASMKKAMGFTEGKKTLWPGKMTVYLLHDTKNLKAFILSVEKRRPTDVGLGSFHVKGEQIHLVACEPMSKDDPSQERQLTEQLVSAAFTKFAGDGNGIPEWMILGFIDATNLENSPKREAELKAALAITNAKNSKNSKDLWAGTLMGKELQLIRTSMVDFLAYGPAQARFPELLRGFKAEQGRQKTIDEVLNAIEQNQTKLNRNWLVWLRKGGKTE